MNRVFEILELEDDKIDAYIDIRLSELDIEDNDDVIFLGDEGKIYPGWIHTNAIYLPSGYRSKGFVIDKQFIKDFIIYTKEQFGSIPLERLKKRLTEDKLIMWFDMYVIFYFGIGYSEIRRKEKYGYGLFDSIGKKLDLSELKDLNIARCIEKSAGLNQILNFIDINSSLVLSDANNVGHAYCLVNSNEKYTIVDPSFWGEVNEKGLPYIFDIDPHSDSFSFDPALYGDNESVKVDYCFPSQKFQGIKR